MGRKFREGQTVQFIRNGQPGSSIFVVTETFEDSVKLSSDVLVRQADGGFSWESWVHQDHLVLYTEMSFGHYQTDHLFQYTDPETEIFYTAFELAEQWVKDGKRFSCNYHNPRLGLWGSGEGTTVFNAYIKARRIAHEQSLSDHS